MDNKVSNDTRRQIIKSIGIAGFLGAFGGSSVKDFIGTARASTDYKDHFQQLTSDHGDLVQTEIADHQKISSSCFNCGDFPDDGVGEVVALQKLTHPIQPPHRLMNRILNLRTLQNRIRAQMQIFQLLVNPS